MVSYIGYKGFDKDLKCQDFQYEIGKSYEMDENPEICTRGYHYCDSLRAVFDYKESNCRICIIKAYGDVDTDDYNKSCTNKIEILKEINISKEDRIRYVYANEHGLSNVELRNTLCEEFILDKYINDEYWKVREVVADQGYDLDILVNDREWAVRRAVAYQGYGLDKLVDDKNYSVRMAVAKQGYGLDKLINDEDNRVRGEVAKQGYGLDILINDEDSYVRICVAEQGYGLDKLINDPGWRVRLTVAKQGYGLDKLVSDPICAIRAAVVEQGYGLDILINDKDWYVRETVAKQGYGLDKLTNDKDHRVRATAAKELKKMKESKHIRLFISQPMSGLSIETIEKTRRTIVECNVLLIKEALKLVGTDKKILIEVINNLQEDKDPNVTKPLEYLAEDTRLLANADVVYFAKGWEKSKKCNIEFQLCKTYDIPMLFES